MMPILQVSVHLNPVLVSPFRHLTYMKNLRVRYRVISTWLVVLTYVQELYKV